MKNIVLSIFIGALFLLTIFSVVCLPTFNNNGQLASAPQPDKNRSQSFTVEISHNKSSATQQTCTSAGSSATMSDRCCDDEGYAAFPAGSSHNYTWPVGVESNAHRQARRKDDSDHARAITAVQPKLGDAAFEKTMYAASAKEFARLQGNSYASR